MNPTQYIARQLDSAHSRIELFEDQRFKKILFTWLDEQTSIETVLSLDVFDTLLIRDNLSELSRFVQIGERISDLAHPIKDLDKIDVFLARQLGTKATYRCSSAVRGCREGSLTEIHRVASVLLFGHDNFTEEFIEAELSYEAERVSPNTLLLEYAAIHRSRGGRTVLISDMYMHATQIHRLLNMTGIDISLFDRIYSSADTKVSKASGGIFPIVEKDMNQSSKEFLHVGDSLKDDFQKPRMHGWNTLHFPISKIEISARRADHKATASSLAKEHGLLTDIRMPS